MRQPFYLFLLLIIVSFPALLFANTGRITGIVKDAQSGDPLPGANIIIQGTALGAATNLEGEFKIERIPVGQYTINISYMGYEKATQEVRVQLDETSEIEVVLSYKVIEGESVVVTALLQGQVEAINKQLSSNTIVNVVSRDKIEELPDQNAAESLARIPGISVQRNAGEAQKVVVRGMAPKFNAITVNG